MNLTITILGLLATVAAAVAAFGSWNAATKANATGERMAAIERDRRHAELTPDFDISCSGRETAADSADLYIALKPGQLDALDTVTVAILDEVGVEHWAHGLPDGVTLEEAQTFVWGPWEFNTGASQQVSSNRMTKARPYSLTDGKNWDSLSLRRTLPGRWMSGPTQDGWREQYEDQPIRLLITCRRDGQEWSLLKDIQPDLPIRARIRVIDV